MSFEKQNRDPKTMRPVSWQSETEIYDAAYGPKGNQPSRSHESLFGEVFNQVIAQILNLGKIFF